MSESIVSSDCFEANAMFFIGVELPRLWLVCIGAPTVNVWCRDVGAYGVEYSSVSSSNGTL